MLQHHIIGASQNNNIKGTSPSPSSSSSPSPSPQHHISSHLHQRITASSAPQHWSMTAAPYNHSIRTTWYPSITRSLHHIMEHHGPSESIITSSSLLHPTSSQNQHTIITACCHWRHVDEVMLERCRREQPQRGILIILPPCARERVTERV